MFDTSALRHALQVLLALCLSLLEFCLLDLLENALHACLHMAATAPLHEMWVALHMLLHVGPWGSLSRWVPGGLGLSHHCHK